MGTWRAGFLEVEPLFGANYSRGSQPSQSAAANTVHHVPALYLLLFTNYLLTVYPNAFILQLIILTLFLPLAISAILSVYSPLTICALYVKIC